MPDEDQDKKQPGHSRKDRQESVENDVQQKGHHTVGELMPISPMTEDEWMSRYRRLMGRQKAQASQRPGPYSEHFEPTSTEED